MNVIEPVDILNLGDGQPVPWWKKLFVRPPRPDLTYPEVIYPDLSALSRTEPVAPQPDLVIDFGTSAITVGVSEGGALDILQFRLRAAAEHADMLETFMGRRRDLPNPVLGENYDLSPVMDRDFGSRWEFHPCLKRRIEWLARTREADGWEPEATLDVAGVCYRALEAAFDERGTPAARRVNAKSDVYLAVPNSFPKRAVEVVSQGVACAVAALTRAEELPKVRTVLEAEAVAYGQLGKPKADDRPLEAGAVLIVDAGAGTTDATVVRVENDALKVVAHAGLPVGGLDLDAFIASQREKGQHLSGLSPIDLSALLREVREQKHKFWSDGGDAATHATADDWAQACEALAAQLSGSRSFPREVGGRSLAQALAAGHRRYLALAVHGLLGCVPVEELEQVTRVIISGRASMVMGFRASVEAAVGRLRKDQGAGVRYLVPGRDDDPTGRERKFAVLRGLHIFAGGAFYHSRRPVRATFDVILRRPINKELMLVAAGLPLVDGWGVRAWHHPLLLEGEPELRHIVAVRLMPRKVLKDLVTDRHFGEEDEERVLDWSTVNVLRFDRPPPFSARVSYNFFNLEASGEIDGEKFHNPPPSSGRHLHPVHNQPEDWFELYHSAERARP
jgi:hypothetical protein